MASTTRVSGRAVARRRGLAAALARLHLELPVGAAVRCSVGGRGYPPQALHPRPRLVGGCGASWSTGGPAADRRAGGDRRPAGSDPARLRRRRDADPRVRAEPEPGGGRCRLRLRRRRPTGSGRWPSPPGSSAQPRQPLAGLAEDGMGMTDLVKRATPNADGLTPAEYQAGAERVAPPGRMAAARGGALRRPGRLAGGGRPPRPARAATVAVRGCARLRDALDQWPQRPDHARRNWPTTCARRSRSAWR